MKETGLDVNFYILGINSDKYIHTLIFFPFLVFCHYLFRKENFIISLMFGFAFASFCEISHYFLPYRDFSIYDYYANILGVLMGSIVFLKRDF
jgi:VanZ family protein